MLMSAGFVEWKPPQTLMDGLLMLGSGWRFVSLSYCF